MKFLVDMNLSSKWSDLGSVSALDHEIMQQAAGDERVVLTHETTRHCLELGVMLAATQAKRPSVLQIRTSGSTPRSLTRH